MFGYKKPFIMYSPDSGAGAGNVDNPEDKESGAAVSGLDMKPTIDFYQENKNEILGRLPETKDDQAIGYAIEQKELIELSESEIAALVNLFPESARERSALDLIKGVPKAWFKKGEAAPTPTNNIDQAISPTAIIPSFHSPSRWPKTEIHLYEIDSRAADPEARKIILSEGLIHEFAHSIITPEIYLNNRKLELSSGEVVEAFTFIMDKFANAVEGHHPSMSHYSSAYMDSEGKFQGDLRVSVNEELAESIAAYLLNFVYCNDKARRFEPFRDRPEVKAIVKEYLEAKLV